MSRAKAILLIALLAATFAVAQDSPSNGTPGQGNTPEDQNSTANRSLNIQGCLSSSAMGDNSFTITEDETGKVYRLTGNVSELASHAGQQVRLSGVTASEQPNSGANPTGNSSPEIPTFQVSGIQMISNHCTGHPPPNDKGAGAAGTPQSAGVIENTPQAQASARNSSSADAASRAKADNNLPQTATILPLLGLVGLSSLVTGFIFRNR